MPKSRPLGQVDKDGMDLPALPQERPVEFAQIPESIQDNVRDQLEHLNDDPRQTRTVEAEVVVPSPELDFDLFQFSMIKNYFNRVYSI